MVKLNMVMMLLGGDVLMKLWCIYILKYCFFYKKIEYFKYFIFSFCFIDVRQMLQLIHLNVNEWWVVVSTPIHRLRQTYVALLIVDLVFNY